MCKLDSYLSNKRFRSSEYDSSTDKRNGFENDFARVVLSSSFRRLQDKTQVFPLEKSDFVRTRLTHSLEVSTFGRSIGITLEDRLIEKKMLSENKRGEIPSLLATAGLIHDLGNPPFGHFGETAIQDFFKEFFEDKKYKDLGLTDKQKADYTKFDGNVQTFRVLKYLQYLTDKEGMNLCYATLATIIKYPFDSLDGNREKIVKDGISKKKFGYFQSEEDAYTSIKNELKLKKRYAFTFLLEAADDIAYSVADIEDACKKGIISTEDIKRLLKNGLENATEEERERNFIDLYEKLLKSVNDKYKNKNELAVQLFRIQAQGFMIKAVIDEFIDNVDDIISGDYDKDILENSYAKNIRKVFKNIADKIFKNKKIIKNELVGYKVMTSLLSEFVPATLNFEDESISTPDKKKLEKIFGLISTNYVFMFEEYTKKDNYSKIQLAVDYISGMTDSFALQLYHELRGHN